MSKLNNIEKFDLMKDKLNLEIELHKQNIYTIWKNNSLVKPKQNNLVLTITRLSVNGFRLYQQLNSKKERKEIAKKNNSLKNALMSVNWLSFLNRD